MASELKSYTPTAEESLRGSIIEILMGLGMQRLPAQHLGGKAAGIASVLPVVGNVMAGQDLQQSQQEGSLLGTMLNAAGAAIPTPGVAKPLTGTAKMLADYAAESAAKMAPVQRPANNFDAAAWAKMEEDLKALLTGPSEFDLTMAAKDPAKLSGLDAVDKAVWEAGGDIPPNPDYLSRFQTAFEGGDLGTLGEIWNKAEITQPSEKTKFSELADVAAYVYGHSPELEKLATAAQGKLAGKVYKESDLYEMWLAAQNAPFKQVPFYPTVSNFEEAIASGDLDTASKIWASFWNLDDTGNAMMWTAFNELAPALQNKVLGVKTADDAAIASALRNNPGASIADLAGMPELNALAMAQPQKFESIAKDFVQKWKFGDSSPLARAEQLGYTQPTYHGTSGSFETNVLMPHFNELSQYEYGLSPKPGMVEFYSTASPELANLYSRYKGGPQPQVLPLLLNTKNYKEWDANGNSWTNVNQKAVKTALKEDWGGVSIRNVYDAPSGPGPLADVFISLDPTTVRSRFAEFDPKKIHLNDLLAGLGGFGIMAPAVMGGQNEQ